MMNLASFNFVSSEVHSTVEDLINKSEADMMKVRNLGKKSLDEVKAKLKDLKLQLKIDEYENI